MTTSLPSKWQIKKIGEIGKIASGGTPKSADPECFDGDIPWITPVDLSGYSDKYISRGRKNLSEKGLKTSSAKILPKNTVLFSSRAPVGYVAIAENDLATNQGFKSVLPSDGIFHEYVYFYLRSAKKLAESMASGTTFLELSGSRFAQIPIPVPPLLTQQAIVSRIDQLFSQLDDGEKALSHAEAQLARYKQAVLNKVYSGDINATARDTPFTPLGKVVEILTGPFGSTLHKHDYVEGGTPLINPININDLKITPSKNVTLDEANTTRLSRYALQHGDVIMARRGEMGRCAHITENEIGWICGTGSLILRPKSNILGEYLSLVISSPAVRHYLDSNCVGTTMKNLNQGILSSLELKVPKLDVQADIVSTYHEEMSLIQNVEEQVARSKELSQTLRQSILHTAFSGQLVKEPTQ
jgi:type I restriction enzyme S subunit